MTGVTDQDLKPEDDGFVAYCDLRVGADGPYRLQAPAWVVEAQLGRIARSGDGVFRVPAYELAVSAEQAGDCQVEVVAFTDEERQRYHAEREDWLAGRREQYPMPPVRLVDEQRRAMFPSAA